MTKTGLHTGLMLLAAGLVAVCACSDDDSDKGTAPQTSTGMCGTDLTMGDAAQDECVSSSCCAELEACASDEACAPCLSGQQEGCDTNPLMAAFWSCYESNACGSTGQGGAGGEGGQAGSAGTAGNAGTAGSAGGGPACDSPQVSCNGKCVDTNTDAANCGACGHDCLGSTCKAGACEPKVLVDFWATPQAFTIDADSIFYHLQYSDGTTQTSQVMKLAKAGGDPVVLAEAGNGVDNLMVRDGTLYWRTSVGSDDQIRSVPVAGGQTKSVTYQFSSMYGFDIEKGAGYAVGSCSNIYRISLQDGSDTQLSKDGCNVFGGGPLGFDVMPDATAAFVMFLKPNNVEELWKVNLGSGTHTVVSSAVKPDELVYHDGWIYFDEGLKVGRIKADGSGKTTIADVAKITPSDGFTAVSRLKVVGGKLYFDASKSGGLNAILESELDGSSSRVVARFKETNKNWEVDEQYVYYLDSDVIARLAK